VSAEDAQAQKERVERSLYERAVGHNYEAVKIFMPAGREKPVYAPYIEHVPPDVTAGIFLTRSSSSTSWASTSSATNQ
jgi:hypothetical protein